MDASPVVAPFQVSPTITFMVEVAGETPKVRAITHFTRWFGALDGLVAIALLMAGRWPSAAGVVIALIPLELATCQIRKAFRRTRVQSPRSAGARTMAVINGTAAVVILFAGALIGGDLILAFTAFFGTWMIGTATLMFVAVGSGPRSNADEKFAPET
jgi:hypothetical protein